MERQGGEKGAVVRLSLWADVVWGQWEGSAACLCAVLLPIEIMKGGALGRMCSHHSLSVCHQSSGLCHPSPFSSSGPRRPRHCHHGHYLGLWHTSTHPHTHRHTHTQTCVQVQTYVSTATEWRLCLKCVDTITKMKLFWTTDPSSIFCGLTQPINLGFFFFWNSLFYFRILYLIYVQRAQKENWLEDRRKIYFFQWFTHISFQSFIIPRPRAIYGKIPT